MSRPQKEGIDYFPVDCQFSDSVKLIQAEFGLVGIGVLLKLWQKIYGDKGYFTFWDEDVALVFSSECGEGANVVSEVVSACLRRGIFNREKFDKYHILTSEGIQLRYAEATERRVSQKIFDEYLLIPIPKNWVSVYINSINVDNNSENVDRNTQSKVNKSKLNNSIVKDSIEIEEKEKKEEREISSSVSLSQNLSCPIINTCTLYENLKFEDWQVDRLVELMGLEQFDIYCQKLSKHISDGGVIRKTPFRIISRWYYEDFDCNDED